MKKILCIVLLLALAVLSVSALAEGARIGALTCIGMTEEDVKQWTSDVAAAEARIRPM